MSSKKTEQKGVVARYWHLGSDDRLYCELCPRECKLHDGQRGLCFVRQRQGGEMILTTYGRSSGFCIDPIEKKPLNHFYPGSAVLSFGTAGCNLSCKFCQNWDISKSREFDRLNDEASPSAIAKAAEKQGCKSVALTYNDPVIFMEYGRDVAEECHKRGIEVVAVTAGYIKPEPRREFFSFIDAANVDLKAFTNSFYRRLTGGDLYTVLDSLSYLRQKTKVWFEITALLIPGENDSVNEIKKMAKWILAELGVETPLHFSAFHPDYKLKTTPPTSLASLVAARNTALEVGLRHVYTGNVYYEPGDTTFCARCGQSLIVRSWYEIVSYKPDKVGGCPFCGSRLAGRFDLTQGNWGSKRKPIRIG